MGKVSFRDRVMVTWNCKKIESHLLAEKAWDNKKRYTTERLSSKRRMQWRATEPCKYHSSLVYTDFPGGSDGKESDMQCGRPQFDSWVRKIPWRREWQSTSVSLSGEPHGQRILAGYSPWGHKESAMTSGTNTHTHTHTHTHTLAYTHECQLPESHCHLGSTASSNGPQLWCGLCTFPFSRYPTSHYPP